MQKTHIQANSARLEADDEHHGLARGRLEARDRLVALPDVHRSVEAVPRETVAREHGLDEVEEARELREDHCAEAGILVAQAACVVREAKSGCGQAGGIKRGKGLLTEVLEQGLELGGRAEVVAPECHRRLRGLCACCTRSFTTVLPGPYNLE